MNSTSIKNAKGVLILFIFSAVFYSRLSSQTINQILEKTYYGASVFTSDFSSTGKIQMGQELTIGVLDEKLNFTGFLNSYIIIGDMYYYREKQISGKFYPDDDMLVFKKDLVLKTDKLPDDLYWCDFSGELKLQSIIDLPGHFGLTGKITDDCGNIHNFALIDYDVSK